MESKFIKVRGARQHNLKNVNLDIPKNKLVVFSGVSGSGKSSMAFDTIYAEGQRRYVESLSSYARLFLGIMEKPDVDLIEGLSPAISIDQKTNTSNPRSTVGTITEIYDYLRLLFARVGHPLCPICGSEIKRQSIDEIVQSTISLCKELLKNKKIIRLMVLSPLVIDKRGEFSYLFSNLKSKGYSQARVDNQIIDLDEEIFLIKTNKHNIDAVMDRLTIEKNILKDKLYESNIKSRFIDSISQALNLSDGIVIVSEINDSSFEFPKYPKIFQDHLFSEKFSCPKDNIQISEIEPRLFSFNSPQGACPNCNGIGYILKTDPDLVFAKEISISEGGIIPFSSMFENDTWYSRLILQVCKEHNIDTKIPIKLLNKEKLDILLNGTGDRVYGVYGNNRFGRQTKIYETFPGISYELEKRYSQSESENFKFAIKKFLRERGCPSCNGTRLKKEALSVKIDGKTIAEICKLDIEKLYEEINRIFQSDKILTQKEKEISSLIFAEIKKRLEFLITVGLTYLSLDRSASTLSAGEFQRIRLASQIGSGLTGVLYVLDEPTVGLHPKDTVKLIETLRKLRDLGNTVIICEHDETVIKSSDYVFDFGPGAGKNGGEIVAEGTPDKISQNKKSLTGLYLSGKKKPLLINNKVGVFSSKIIQNDHKPYLFNSEQTKPSKKDGVIQILGCNLHNLKNIDVTFPLNKLIVITGVSGSGKSTLLVDTLYPALIEKIRNGNHSYSNGFRQINGIENINKVILIDQTPIGKTPRSNPATYTKVFDEIREIFAQTRDAKILGFNKSRFSFNLKGGRCESCEGQGQIKIEMQFMNDIWVKCDICKGKRYNNQTLEILYKGKNIYEVLKMTVNEAIEFFHSNHKVLEKLNTLASVGLGYIELGQSATTLSGGEAQRVKLAAELTKKETGNTLYILDEPTTGLHSYDVEMLLGVLKLLVSKGNTVVVIEHNLSVIRNADWIIDLGPEGGEMGGYILYQGELGGIKNIPSSYTAKFL